VTTAKTHVNKINTVVIPVADQQRMVDFYVERLGLEKRTDVAFGNGYRWVEVAPAGAVTTIALAPPPEGNSTGGRETGIGLQADDIDAFHAHLKAEGVDVDPEGNTLMVNG
jgi:catechol 2,3-dioxygenase-like lactoylglutathione lyase family enzyme